jgi:DNA mismatch repair ATPase MutS
LPPSADKGSEIVFLYRLLPSLSHRSFGTYVGRLAGLPNPVLERADEKSEWMRRRARRRWISVLAGKFRGVGVGNESEFKGGEVGEKDTVVDVLEAVKRVC